MLITTESELMAIKVGILNVGRLFELRDVKDEVLGLLVREGLGWEMASVISWR